ncbi:MAG TPA: hypothetical protein VHW47_03630, partial [Acidimicrobiales bacterium]|nr:hypothetical protein [Acidimicrobiales bacterium]
IRTTGPYFVTATPFHELTFELGYSLGPGALLVACGAFVVGWAVRHQRPIGRSYPAFVAVPAPVPAAVPPQPQPSPAAVPTSDPSVPPAVEGPPPMPDVVDTTLSGELPDGEPVIDPTLTGVVPAVRPVPPAPEPWEQRSGRPVEPDLTGSWPVVPPPGPSAPPWAPPPGWRVPDVTGPVEEP